MTEVHNDNPSRAQQQSVKAQLRPTLMIGIGGTGQKVLVQLKARFLRNYGDIPSTIKFLCFDTDPAVAQTRMDSQIVSLTSPNELVYIGGIQIAEILDTLPNRPAIASWIIEDKDNLKSMAVQAIVAGCHAVRPLGRLAFFWNISVIADKIKQALGDLVHITVNQEVTAGVNVFIVSSVCGGTGSGAILDMAYLTRKMMDSRGIKTDACYINGILALPSVFPNVEQTGIGANAYATLRELDQVNTTGEWHCNYGSPTVGTVDYKGVRPFKICYLVDAANENGRGLAGMDEVAPMIAEAVYLQIGSQVGTANNSQFDNVPILARTTLDIRSNVQKVTAYSSLGTASLVFPAQRIIDTCSQRLGRELIENRLLRETKVVADGPTQEKSDPVANYVQVQQLDATNVLLQVARDARGSPLRLALNAGSVMNQVKENQLQAAVKAYVDRMETTVDGEYDQILELNRKTLAEKLATAINSEADRLVDDPSEAGGIRAAMSFLERLNTKLESIRRELEKGRLDRVSVRDRNQQQIKTLFDEFTRSFQGPFHGKKVKTACERYVQKCQDYLSARFDARKCEVAASLLAGLSLTMAAKLRVLQGALNRLQYVRASFDTSIKPRDKVARMDYLLAQNITTDEDVDRYYHERVDRLGSQMEVGLVESQKAGAMHTWLELDQDALTARVLSYAHSVFEDIAQTTIENVILDKAAPGQNQVTATTRLDNLIENSVPFWNYRNVRMAQGWDPSAIIVIGVNDNERSIYTNNIGGQGTSLISTFDPHVITVMQTKHGLPLFALTQYPDYHEKAESVTQSNEKPLYVLPEVRPGGEKAKQVFANGIAYGFIFKAGTSYYVLPDDPLRPPLQLEKGMIESLRVFRNNDELIKLVEAKVQNEIDSGGSDKAVTLLTAFIERPYVKEYRGGIAGKVKIDRETMVNNISFGNPNSQNYDVLMGLRDLARDVTLKELQG